MLTGDQAVPSSSQESLPDADGSQILHPNHSAVPDLKLIHRFTIRDYDRNETSCDRVQLLLGKESSPFMFKCTLIGTWVTTNLLVGDIVNVFSNQFTSDEGFLISDTAGFIVVNPDNLISCTSVASTLFCTRKAWLNEKFKGWGTGNKIMLIGTLVHELLQTCCLKQLHRKDEIEQQMKELLTGIGILQSAYLNEMTEQELAGEVRKYIPWIVQWMDKYVVKEAGELHDDARMKLKILKFVDIEDNIWCHYNGTKGKVDFTVEVRIYDNKNFTSRKAVLPMELKTGKSSFSAEHVAQATLYSMMMHDRQFGECDSALLLYLKDGPKLKLVSPSDPTRIALIQRRNDHEYFTRQDVVGPDFKDSSHLCSKCDHLLDCSLMARNFEPDKLEAASQMPILCDGATEHLSQDEVSFFGQWVQKLYDHRNGPNIGNDFWNQTAEQREEQGLSLAGMRIIRSKKFTYTFARSEKYDSRRDVSLVIKDWNVRERVAISLDPNPGDKRDMVAVLTGFIEKLEDGEVTCTFDKSLQKSLERNVFRIDRLARSTTAFLSNFNSLLRLMSQTDASASSLRRSVIGKQTSPPTPIHRSTAIVVQQTVRGVDKKIKEAIVSALTCGHFSLFQYSSESESLLHQFLLKLSQIESAVGKSVLIVAPSTTSVDNLLKFFKSQDFSFLRLIRSSQDGELNQYCEDKRLEGCNSVSKMRKIYDSEHVVACTISGIISHPYFELRKSNFEFGIVLDADQPLLTQSLAPLFRCNRFLLIRNKDRDVGADNLFSHLAGEKNVFDFTVDIKVETN
jgi:DNA replication ATP-dependent helicase Dna2